MSDEEPIEAESNPWKSNNICPKCNRQLITDAEKYSNECGICTIERITGKPFIPWDNNDDEPKEEKEEETGSNGNQNLNSYNNDNEV